MVPPVITVGRRSILVVLLLIGGGVLAGLVYGVVRTQQVEKELLRLPADEISSHEALVAFATERGPYLFVDHCASCHGTDMRGDTERGIPDLQDAVWLSGEGRISEIEHTIQYGVRSGHPKAQGRQHGLCPSWIDKLDAADVRELAVYLHQVSHRSEAKAPQN